jgi:hypothetical protein
VIAMTNLAVLAVLAVKAARGCTADAEDSRS